MGKMMAGYLTEGLLSAASHVSGIVHENVHVTRKKDKSRVENHGHQSDENATMRERERKKSTLDAFKKEIGGTH